MISPAGNEALLIMAINQGLIVPCYSAEILEEYSDVLLRPKFQFSAEEVDALLSLLRSHGNSFTPVPSVPVSSDPDDDKFIACAIAGKAMFLVTGNKRHFPQSESWSAKVVNAAELLEFITLEL